MDTKNQKTAQITCLQKNLSAIRKIAGWTAEQLGEKIGVIQMRGLGAWYLKGLKDNAITRQKLNKANTKEEMVNIFKDYLIE